MSNLAAIKAIEDLEDEEERWTALVANEYAWNHWKSPYDMIQAAAMFRVADRAIVLAGAECVEMMLRQYPEEDERLTHILNRVTHGGRSAYSIYDVEADRTPLLPNVFDHVFLAVSYIDEASLYFDTASIVMAVYHAVSAVSWGRGGRGWTVAHGQDAEREARLRFAQYIRRTDGGPLRWDVVEEARETPR